LEINQGKLAVQGLEYAIRLEISQEIHLVLFASNGHLLQIAMNISYKKGLDMQLKSREECTNMQGHTTLKLHAQSFELFFIYLSCIVQSVIG